MNFLKYTPGAKPGVKIKRPRSPTPREEKKKEYEKTRPEELSVKNGKMTMNC